MGRNLQNIEVEEEIDGRWIAEAVDVPGALAYGKTVDEAIDGAAALRGWILEDRKQHGDSDTFTRGE